jgi:uncharacterized protein DUF4241
VETVVPLAFEAPAAFWDPEGEERVQTERFEVGMLPVPTGRLAIHDPGYEFAPEVLDRTVQPGIYPVDLALRSWTNPDGTVAPAALTAAARISFGGGRADRHVHVRSADGASDLVFGVDSGLISVFDRSLLAGLNGAAILDRLPDDVPGRRADRPPASVEGLPTGGSLFVCQAGMGDGAYRAWWGLGEDDEPTELIVDFGLLEYSRWRTVEFPAAAMLGSAARLRLAIAGTGLDLEPVPFDSLGMPPPPTMSGDLIALRRPAGGTLEFRLLDSDGTVVGNPGLAQLVPGPWFDIFRRAQVERAETVRVRIHEGTMPLEVVQR